MSLPIGWLEEAVRSAAGKMSRMQEADPNCIPSEIDYLILSLADELGIPVSG